ncbi:hypothetical protein DL991_06120 [Amycolatopsis sp. WAC 01375]|uniref:hypothetical protein n=1 Tax=unclassified Amycolatopsis TaxID=2618356 RepID=UPI000F7B337B|nr:MULTISPECIES: hypothetical protein [unclassified Amycolatopsis]RSM53620.1 hypothetical protein DMH03_38180 [Amycolatopsis sp. WAC 01376]RSM82037.1 hypothetical protein DL991_06120 [Amycolatopsis sp. WAC 01375]RSN22675.1 hypothetical protein DL990_36780 [Amycolatopsis sp. WAC 01416]
MSEFAVNLRDRVRQAREDVQIAKQASDEDRASAVGADLANLERLAAEHGVELPEQTSGDIRA